MVSGLSRRRLLQGLSGTCAFLAERPAAAQRPAVRKTVYAWYPMRFGNWNTSSLQWDAITHICYRSVTLQGDGTLANTDAHPPKAFVDMAHENGVKVSVLAWANTAQDTDSYLASHAQETAQSLLQYVRAHGLDGIAYDDERIRKTNSLTGGPSGPLVSAFFEKLQETVKAANPTCHIAFAAPPVISPNDRYGASWLDWPSIAQAVDAIVPMIYTASPPSIGWTTSPEPLAGSRAGGPTVARDVVTLMEDYYRALGDHRSKLLLGMNSFPFRGYEFQARTAERLAPTLGPGKPQPFEYLEAQAARYGKRWDSEQQAAWYVYREGDHFVQGWYDDNHSWAAKLDYVNRQGLGGIGIWAVDGANDSPEMWEMLRAAFAGPKSKV